MKFAPSLLLGVAALAAACGIKPETERRAADRSLVASVPTPLHAADAYAAAKTIQLAAPEPEEGPGLQNVFHLSANIISGSEPHGPEALDALAAMGVKTLVSVDGKIPEAEAARARGMRYVHVPIQYSGISRDEMLALTKTFRELEPPFYVHCFHGKHRGPAAAALGRIVLDGVSRTRALAEMRQWCGTSSKYTGLYAVIGGAEIPPPSVTEAHGFAFPEARSVTGLREAMVRIPRAFDALKALAKRDFAASPAHPDVDALNESRKLAEIFASLEADPEVALRPADFRAWIDRSARESVALRDHLEAVRAGTPSAVEAARGKLDRIKASCNACHQAYRN